jgi:hypothetical protein
MFNILTKQHALIMVYSYMYLFIHLFISNIYTGQAKSVYRLTVINMRPVNNNKNLFNTKY